MQQMMQSASAAMTACQVGSASDNTSHQQSFAPAQRAATQECTQAARPQPTTLVPQTALVAPWCIVPKRFNAHSPVPRNSAGSTPPSTILRKRMLAVLTACERAALAFMCKRDKLKHMAKKQQKSKGLLMNRSKSQCNQ
eukprot:6189516-Pleurochrysis_carterae.AAC.4